VLQVAFAALYLEEAADRAGGAGGEGGGGGSKCTFFLLPLAPCCDGVQEEGVDDAVLPIPCASSSEQRWGLLLRVLRQQQHQGGGGPDKVCFDAQLALVAMFEWQKQRQHHQLHMQFEQQQHQRGGRIGRGVEGGLEGLEDIRGVHVLDPKVAAFVLDTSAKSNEDKLTFECLVDKYVNQTRRQQSQQSQMSQQSQQSRQSQMSQQSQRDIMLSPSSSLAASSSPSSSSMEELLRGLRANLHLTLLLHRALAQNLTKVGADWSYRMVETPLVPLLARMEVVGIRFDGLKEGLHERVQEQLDRLSFFAHKVAGCEFNLASPEQVWSMIVLYSAPLAYQRSYTALTPFRHPFIHLSYTHTCACTHT
jgi:hypothetical protein